MAATTFENKKFALVTGATGAIGRAIAQRLAEHHNFEVILACRDEAKAKSAVTEIQQETGNAKVRYTLVDLSLGTSIRELAERWRDPLHVLVNNAAVAPRKREETAEGIEMQFATNVLGYFRLTRIFQNILSASSPARVINVASYWAGGLALDDLEFRKRPYDNDSAYRQSKQANRMLTLAFAEQFEPLGVTVNSCHPGDVHSTLSHALGFGGHESAEQAARTPVWLATAEAGGINTGKYFEYQKRCVCRFSNDQTAVTELFQACEGYH